MMMKIDSSIQTIKKLKLKNKIVIKKNIQINLIKKIYKILLI